MADDPDSWPGDADVASAALAFYEAMPKNGKPQPCEFTVFAGKITGGAWQQQQHEHAHPVDTWMAALTFGLV